VDTRFTISQSASFPKVYANQKRYLTEEWKSSVLNMNVRQADLKKQVALLFYNLLFLQEKRKLLQEHDSLFTEFLNKATLRFEKGETNVLEKTTAENQKGQVSLQLSELQQDIGLLQTQLQLLLNSSNTYTADENNLTMPIVAGMDSASLQTHPLIQYLEQRRKVAQVSTNVERSKLSPNLNLGYGLMSIKGTGANDKIYDATPRFQSAQIGLGIPIFNGAQKARINAAKVNEQIATGEYDIGLQKLESSYKTRLMEYEKFEKAVAYYESTALRNAELIVSTANKQFINGDINYLDWVILVNQSVAIRSNYIEALRNLNESAVEINFILNK
jgi:heavy metal efflux system protein